jgi:D-alanine-D-alanine ligase
MSAAAPDGDKTPKADLTCSDLACSDLHGLDVAILHDPVPQDAPPDRQDTLAQAHAVAHALTSLGLAPRLVPFGPDMEAARRELCARLPRLAVNLVESLAGLERLAFTVPALLAALGVPFTGSDAQALLATSDKSEVKRRLRQAGLATPGWLSSRPRPGDPVLQFASPALFILKPEHTHGSVGIGEDAVVRAENAAHLAALLAERSRVLHQSCLAEAFVPGREFGVSVLAGRLGPKALPPAEMHFFAFGADETKVLTYASKWEEDCAAHADTRRAFPGDEPELLAVLADAALASWRVFGLAGYARLDFRVGPCGVPQIIDVNANPCLAKDGGFAAAALQAGLGFEALVTRIVRAALGWPKGTTSPDSPALKSGAPAVPRGGPGTWRTRVLPDDAEAVRRLVAATGFFSAEEVVIAGELVTEHLAKGDASGYFYVFADESGPEADGPEAEGPATGGKNDGPQRSLAGYACYGPTPGTADSFDLYWIAVAPKAQGQGLGGQILARAEADMAARGARGIYVETSSRGQYLPTREFYEKHGYAVRARLDGFYQAGDDKIIYNKRLF